jgi:protein O-GlcNAc transferase
MMTESLQDAYRLHQVGKIHEAEQLYCEILRVHPQNFDALYLLGIAQLQLGRPEDGERRLAEATKVNPLSLDALRNRGRALQLLARHAEALTCYDRALAIDSYAVPILVHRADALFELKRIEEALSAYRAALTLRDDYPDAWYNCGITLLTLSRTEEALSCFERACTLNPRDLHALIHCSILSLKHRRYPEALASLDRILAVDPAHLDTLVTRASLLTGMKRYEEAGHDYEKALTVAPDHPYLRGDLLQCRLYCCDWRSLEDQKQSIAADLLAGKRIARPIANAMWSHSPQDQLLCAQIWIAHESPAAKSPLWCGERYHHDRIRIAYLAPELHGNAVATQIVGVFEHHDSARFETTMLAFGRDEGSEMRARVENSFEQFIDIRSQSDIEAARLLREREIDILIDLAGITGNCRTGVLALRPSPVQVNYLGFPATMGAHYVDYLIADPITIAPHQRADYAENIVYLPDTYMPNDATRGIAVPPPSRREASLPENGFVFCSFNNSFKIMPEMFDVWTRLLTAVGDSVLWLPEFPPAAMRNLKHEAEIRGVNAERLLFAPFAAAPERHLARMQLADLFLDTLPYNAHSTACDALWAGLPVLTCIGSTFAGRVAASTLQAAGLPELVTGSLEEFETAALRLARKPAALSAVRARLAKNRDTWPLFNTGRFTRHLESAYITMWERQQRGEAPASFSVEAIPNRDLIQAQTRDSGS